MCTPKKAGLSPLQKVQILEKQPNLDFSQGTQGCILESNLAFTAVKQNLSMMCVLDWLLLHHFSQL